MACPICGGEVRHAEPSDPYVNVVCKDCDQRAVNEDGDEPWVGFPPGEEPPEKRGNIASDDGQNPVFIDGQKCWRLFKFGGWITMADEHDCDSWDEFLRQHYENYPDSDDDDDDNDGDM